MKWSEISIQTSHEATEAIANIFHDLGASGVVIEDPELINTYRRSGSWDYCDIPEELETEVVTVKAYLPVDEFLDDKLRVFEERVNHLQEHNLDKGRGCINCREVQEEDWASAWKEFFHPVRVSEHIVIKPSWEEYLPAEGDIIIEIDPGMAFGTGTHQTTSMCIRFLEDVIKSGHTVFDVGTGSGILAVAAAKLGANAVHAIDLDSVAVRVATENVAFNKVADTVSVAQGDLLTGVTGKADVIVANIIADIIIKMLPDVRRRLTEKGVFIASGIITERLSDVTQALIENEFVVDKVTEEGGWVAIMATCVSH
ncbi:50S ribosomal protein L11 methyltransferase [Sporomusa acidovorans]|uniref:Ribosomal protein L11 methyltransferase n=1 Tax=Sporomusa acidovorans (strain ATCC 49682 / DSM 3132 / Mol) TaxID=1123286 RepID=A0ABZ3J3R0_SPOA4|nr:50S ribosomal protein L11 methyltransferase [Sporomusa acidovorans]OZC23114.1 ribosomal protein L11 methyltransferase [Sporomusa acidovorans DSM 3132]SDF05853.1 ribosomal protein L11 methyltransferase [Sporomusa acidovorans]